MIVFSKKYIIILAIFTFWLGGIPFIFSKTLPVVCENLSFNTKYDIRIENPKLKLNIIPLAVIKADKLVIKEKGTDEILFVQNPVVKIRLLPLLSGNLHINKIKASNVNLITSLKKNLILDKDFFDNLDQSKITFDGIKLDSFNVRIKQNEISKSAVYSGNNFYFRKNGRYIKLNIDSNINIDGQSSDVKGELFLPKNNDINKSIVDFHISNLDIAPIADYLRNYLPEDLESVNGRINIDVNKNNLKANLENISFIMKDSAKSMVFPNNLSVTSQFNLTRSTFSIISSEILSKNINLNLSGSITNYLDKSMSFLNLNVLLNKSKVEDIINLLPPIVTEDINLYKLKKYKFYADAIGNFTIKGDILEPALNGNIYISNGILTKPIKNTNGATVKLEFLGKYLNYDVCVPTDKYEKVRVKGGVELYNVKYADMHIWSTKNVDLALAEEKIIPIHEILNFVIGPVPIMEIKGLGNIDILVKGNRQNPHVWGVLNVNNAFVRFNEIPDLILKNADAVLTFDDENAVFILNRGRINNKDVNLRGTCNLAGKFDFDFSAPYQDLGYLYNALETSTMIDELKNMLPKVSSLNGLSNLNIKVFGNVKHIEDLKFNQNFFFKGQLDFLGNKIEGINQYNRLKLSELKGNAVFNGLDIVSQLTSKIGNSPVDLNFNLKNKTADFCLKMARLNLLDITEEKDNFYNDFGNIFVDVILKYKGKLDDISVENIEHNKIDFDLNILESDKNNKLQLSNGNIILRNGKFSIKNVKGNFLNTNSSFDLNFRSDNIKSLSDLNGTIQLNDFELSLINEILDNPFVPENITKFAQDFNFNKGKINLNALVKNNNITASTDLGGIEFIYTPLDLPVKVINGSLYVRKSYLGLNKINLLADGMPILIDGGIKDIFSKKEFNLYLNSKPKQAFIDKYINNNKVYPIKIKGDIVYRAKIKGVADNLNIISEANIEKDSSIYYLGAMVGDIENAIVLNLDMNILKQKFLKIKEFSYDKLIDSLSKRQTRLNMLKANGGIDIQDDDLVFHDLRIQTSNPTDARVFNIIFRKPNIKQGQFTSNLRINGKLSNPHVLGDFHIFETNIPFLDTTMKNVTFAFKDRVLDINSTGEILGNDIKFSGTLKNKLSRPYYVENAEIFTKVIDLNYIVNKLKMSQVDEYKAFESFDNFSISNLIVKNIKMTANGIKLRNLTAENVIANASLNEKQIFDISNFKFDIASGSLNGSFQYDIQSGKTNLDLKSKDISANDISYAIFELENQIYGDLTGNIKLSCIGTDFDKCMETLSGKTTFNVANGRMPKLGSLEYLLKAGNLLKGGVTGLSINGIIDLITPLKTGDFSNIYGNITIKDGVADNIEISTRGKDLNLFITGTYNLSDSNADMEVFGILSKKISTMFGPVGNISLNSLFNIIPGIDLTKDSLILEKINKIPAIELSEKMYRKFIAEIKGNINGDDYVSSFKWIN